MGLLTHAPRSRPCAQLTSRPAHAPPHTTRSPIHIDVRRAEKVGKLAIDKDGAPSPIVGSAAYQMRSVAVPFGNCIEPSNVKAGGKACPIRFQCAGCGFYRPDLSYIPAIEEHINSLAADREIAMAMDAAPFVVDNLQAQIDAFRNMLDVMRESLNRLDAERRDEVEQASSVLRKARAGATLPLQDITRRRDTR